MASVGAKESQTATQTVSITAVPTTSHGTEATLVQQISTIADLDLLLSDSNKTILIEFFAEWCGPCKLIAQKLEKWAKNYEVTIVKIDIDELEDVAIEYNVTSIPAFVFLKDRQILEQFEGSQEDTIIAALERICKINDVDTKQLNKLDAKNKNTMPANASEVVDLPNVSADETEKN